MRERERDRESERERQRESYFDLKKDIFVVLDVSMTFVIKYFKR